MFARIVALAGLIGALIAIFGFVTGYISLGQFLPTREYRCEGKAGEWLQDRFLQIRIPHAFSGPFLNVDGYDLKIDIENRLSAMLVIRKIVSKRFNAQFKSLLGMNTDLVFTNEHNIPIILEAHETTHEVLGGNEALPARIELLVYHDGSGDPSKFQIDVSSTTIKPVQPKKMASGRDIGFDGLAAVLRAKNDMYKHTEQPLLVSAIPTDYKISIDTQSGLRLWVVEGWVVYFIDPNGKQFWSIVKSETVTSQAIGATDNPPAMPYPKIGDQEAIAKVNSADLIYGNWKSLSLKPGKMRNELTCYWSLPYLGPDGLPLMVDARSGEIVRITGADNKVAILEPFKKP